MVAGAGFGSATLGYEPSRRVRAVGSSRPWIATRLSRDFSPEMIRMLRRGGGSAPRKKAPRGALAAPPARGAPGPAEGGAPRPPPAPAPRARGAAAAAGTPGPP